MSLTITQGDYVYYQDTSSGGPNGWTWNFSGGSPTGSTAQNPLVRYLSPSTPGFDTVLTASKTIPGGIILTSVKTEPNLIKVNAENLTVSLSATPSTIRMSQNVVYGASGPTGNLSYYTWSLAGTAGYTGLTASQSLNVINWLTLTGSELGATYSTYSTSSSVTVTSILSNTANSTVNVTYSKNGPVEIYNYLDIDIYQPNVSYSTTTAVAGGALLTSNPTLALSGSGYLFNIDTHASVPKNIDNQYFRAHGEFLAYFSPSMDFAYLSQYGYIPGQLVTAFNALTLCGLTPPPLTRYTQGNYMLPGDIGTYFGDQFIFADVLSVTKTLVDNRYWTVSDVESIVFSDTSVASQSSRSLEIGGIPTHNPVAYKEQLDGGYGTTVGGICLPSFNYANAEIILTLKIEYSVTGSISGINSSLDDNIEIMISNPGLGGGMGNTPNGLLITAQDTAYGSQTGLASLINSELAIRGYSGYIGATASSAYAWTSGNGIAGGPGTTYSDHEFPGLGISILDRGPTGPVTSAYITRITISDNGPWVIPPNPLNTYTAAGGTYNWLGFYNDYIANPWQITNQADSQPRREWYFGLP
jgi:hypothetical protein